MLGIVIMRSLSVLLRSDPRNPRMRFPAWRWEETCGKRIDVPLSFQGQEVWSSMSPFYWAVLLEDLKCLGEETAVHIWLMRSFGNWAPRATEIIGSTCDHSSQSPAHVRKHSWVSWDDPSCPGAQLPYLVPLPFLGTDSPSLPFNI